MTRIVFAHGLEGSPDGTKATYLRDKLGAVTPWLGEFNLDDQVGALEKEIPQGSDAVVVGSSLGGLAALGFAVRHSDRIRHLVLLAPAVGMHRYASVSPEVEQKRPGLFEQSKKFGALSVPPSIRTTVIHGLNDEVIARQDVIDLVERSPSATLLLVHDDHTLSSSRELILHVVERAMSGKLVV